MFNAGWLYIEVLVLSLGKKEFLRIRRWLDLFVYGFVILAATTAVCLDAIRLPSLFRHA